MGRCKSIKICFNSSHRGKMEGYECRILTTLLLNVLLIFMVHGMSARVLIDFSVSEGCWHIETLPFEFFKILRNNFVNFYKEIAISCFCMPFLMAMFLKFMYTSFSGNLFSSYPCGVTWKVVNLCSDHFL